MTQTLINGGDSNNFKCEGGGGGIHTSSGVISGPRQGYEGTAASRKP